MFKKLSIIVLSLLPTTIFASDYDDAVSTILSNNLTLKYGVAENAATLEELKAENTLEAA